MKQCGVYVHDGAEFWWPDENTGNACKRQRLDVRLKATEESKNEVHEAGILTPARPELFAINVYRNMPHISSFSNAS